MWITKTDGGLTGAWARERLALGLSKRGRSQVGHSPPNRYSADYIMQISGPLEGLDELLRPTGAVTDLRVRPPASVEYLQVVLSGTLKSTGMPAFELDDETDMALYAYLINNAWDAYENDAGVMAHQ